VLPDSSLSGRTGSGVSGYSATNVANQAMTRGDRAELERLVLTLERQHPEWSARDIEHELAQRAPVSYGNWKDDTGVLSARLRQVQRWRTGARGRSRAARADLSYTYLWPIGVKQRKRAEPGFAAPSSRTRASHRLFLTNCSTETIRELRARITGQEVAYDPAVPPGGFSELHWTRNESIRKELLAAADHQTLRYALEVDFAVANGRKRAALKGELSMDSTDGWTLFATSGSTTKEIE
jgi:hypothetical protein